MRNWGQGIGKRNWGQSNIFARLPDRHKALALEFQSLVNKDVADGQTAPRHAARCAAAYQELGSEELGSEELGSRNWGQSNIFARLPDRHKALALEFQSLVNKDVADGQTAPRHAARCAAAYHSARKQSSGDVP